MQSKEASDSEADLVLFLGFYFDFKVFFLVDECWQEHRFSSWEIKLKLVFKFFTQDFFVSHPFAIFILDLGSFLESLITVKEIAQIKVKNKIHVKVGGWIGQIHIGNILDLGSEVSWEINGYLFGRMLWVPGALLDQHIIGRKSSVRGVVLRMIKFSFRVLVAILLLMHDWQLGVKSLGIWLGKEVEQIKNEKVTFYNL